MLCWQNAKRRGEWLPPHPHLEGWVAELVKEAEKEVEHFLKGKRQLSPAIHKFYEVITTNSVLWMHFEEMIKQVCALKQSKTTKIKCEHLKTRTLIESLFFFSPKACNNPGL